MQEKPENNERIWNNGTSRAGSRVADRKQKLYLELPYMHNWINYFHLKTISLQPSSMLNLNIK